MNQYTLLVIPSQKIVEFIDKYRMKYAEYTNYIIPPHFTIYPPFLCVYPWGGKLNLLITNTMHHAGILRAISHNSHEKSVPIYLSNVSESSSNGVISSPLICSTSRIPSLESKW